MKLAAVVVAVLLAALGGLLLLQVSVVERRLEEVVADQVTAQTSMLYNLVAGSYARLSIYRRAEDEIIRQHLIGVARSLRSLCRAAYQMELRGLADRASLQKLVGELMLETKIGFSGYPFVWDVSQAPDKIPLVVHPKIQSQEVSRYDFVREGARLKNGYLEYEWANPDDPAPRAKAMGLAYFQPWEWVIAASAYKEEFNYLVDQSFYVSNRERLLEEIRSIRLGKRGYAWISDRSGNLIVQPDDPNLVMTLDLSLLRMAESGQGLLVQERGGEKIVLAYRYFEPLKWILISTAYLSDYIDPPMNSITRIGMIATGLIALIIAGVLIVFLHVKALRPIQHSAAVARRIARGDLDVEPLPVRSDDEIGKLSTAINHMAGRIKDTLDRLAASERSYRTLFENSPDAIFTLDTEGICLEANQAAADMLGYSRQELSGMSFSELVPPEEVEPLRRIYGEMYATGEPILNLRHIFVNKNGELLQMEGSAAIIRNAAGRAVGSQTSFRDVTEQRQLEQQLLRAQKMESLGTLAGGIAHDFNNLLTGILGYTSVILADDELDPKLADKIRTIDQSAQRAAELTERLLAFARSEAVSAGPLDVNLVAGEVKDILARTIDRSIDLKIDLADDLPVISGAASQIHQALLNLCINARDAMPEGGRLTISTRLEEVDADHPAAGGGLKPGRYVCLSVADTGHGISSETAAKMFDPFFTTKPEGQGTGLGLSVVYGIARRHQGSVQVESKPGRGSVFSLYLPVRPPEQTAAPSKEETVPAVPPATVLVVDDERSVREMVADILSEIGLDVVSAEDGQVALDILSARPEAIDLVILDLIMPRLNGALAFEMIRRIRPDLPVVLSSGFPRDARITEMLKGKRVEFLSKPYRVQALIQVVGRLLDQD